MICFRKPWEAGFVKQEKKEELLLKIFLDKHASEMPKTMLRYAVAKLDKELREKYLKRISPLI